MLLIRASLRELKPQMAAILEIVDEEFEAVGCETTTLTSCWREFGSGSLHPYGYSADFDSEQMPENLNDSKWGSLRIRLQERLGNEFDVVVHGPRAHAHIEWDPRVPEPSTVQV